MPLVTSDYKTAAVNDTDFNTLVYKGDKGGKLNDDIKSLSLSEDTANGNALTFAIAFTSKDKGPMERAKAQLATIGITAEEAQAGGILRARVTSRDVMARAAIALATDVAIGKGDAHYGVINPDVATEIVSQEVGRDPKTYSAEKLNLLSLKNNTMSALDAQLRGIEQPFSSLDATIPFSFSLVTNINEDTNTTVVGGKPAVLVQTEVTTKSGAAEAVVAAAKAAGLKYEVSLESDRAQLRSPKGAILDTSKGDRITIEAPANTVAEALKKSGVLSDFIADPIIARAEQLHPGQQEINQTVNAALQAGVEGQARWNTAAEETATGAGGITRSGTVSRSASGGMQIDPITGEMTRNVTRATRGARGGSSPFDLSGVSYGVDGSSNGPIGSLNRPAQDFTTRTNANAQIQGNTGERKFSNIRLIGDNALTIDPAGIVIGNPMILDIARVNPETINEPATRAFFDDQVAGYSSRLLAAVNEEFGYNAHDRQSIFAFGLNTAGIENPAMIDALRQRYDRLTANGDIPAGLEVFKQYGDHLIRNTNQDRVFQRLKQASAQVLENAPTDLLAQRTEQLEKALNQLPPDLVEAANRIGTKIIVSDDHDAMQFASRTIHISKDTLASGDEQLKTILKEEMTHYVDKFLGFTDQPEWRHAVETSTKNVDTNALTAESLRALMDAPGDLNTKLQVVQEALEAQIRIAANNAVGKIGTDTYDARDGAAELLPDILNARTVLEQSGESAEYIERSLTGIYGKEAVQMVDTYLAQVKQVAEGSHPRIIEEKSNTILKTALANAEIPTAMQRSILGRIQSKLNADPNYTGESALYTDASGRSITLGDMVTKATQGISGGNLMASELAPSERAANPISMVNTLEATAMAVPAALDANASKTSVPSQQELQGQSRVIAPEPNLTEGLGNTGMNVLGLTQGSVGLAQLIRSDDPMTLFRGIDIAVNGTQLAAGATGLGFEVRALTNPGVSSGLGEAVGEFSGRYAIGAGVWGVGKDVYNISTSQEKLIGEGGIKLMGSTGNLMMATGSTVGTFLAKRSLSMAEKQIAEDATAQLAKEAAITTAKTGVTRISGLARGAGILTAAVTVDAMEFDDVLNMRVQNAKEQGEILRDFAVNSGRQGTSERYVDIPGIKPKPDDYTQLPKWMEAHRRTAFWDGDIHEMQDNPEMLKNLINSMSTYKRQLGDSINDTRADIINANFLGSTLAGAVNLVTGRDVQKEVNDNMLAKVNDYHEAETGRLAVAEIAGEIGVGKRNYTDRFADYKRMQAMGKEYDPQRQQLENLRATLVASQTLRQTDILAALDTVQHTPEDKQRVLAASQKGQAEDDKRGQEANALASTKDIAAIQKFLGASDEAWKQKSAEGKSLEDVVNEKIQSGQIAPMLRAFVHNTSHQRSAVEQELATLSFKQEMRSLDGKSDAEKTAYFDRNRDFLARSGLDKRTDLGLVALTASADEYMQKQIALVPTSLEAESVAQAEANHKLLDHIKNDKATKAKYIPGAEKTIAALEDGLKLGDMPLLDDKGNSQTDAEGKVVTFAQMQASIDRAIEIQNKALDSLKAQAKTDADPNLKARISICEAGVTSLQVQYAGNENQNMRYKLKIYEDVKSTCRDEIKQSIEKLANAKTSPMLNKATQDNLAELAEGTKGAVKNYSEMAANYANKKPEEITPAQMQELQLAEANMLASQRQLTLAYGEVAKQPAVTMVNTAISSNVTPASQSQQLETAKKTLGAVFDKLSKACSNEAMASVIAEFSSFTHGDLKNNNPTINGITASTGSRAPLAAGNRDVV